MTDSADGDAPEPTPLTSVGGQAVEDTRTAGSGPIGNTDGAVDADAAPTLHPTPGGLDDLAPKQLALTGQWTALAALAHHAGTEEPGLLAVRQLARHAGTPDVFRWLWAVLDGQSHAGWGELSHLPPGLVLPGDLVDAVIAEVAASAAPSPQRQQAHIRLLLALDPDDGGTAQVAWAVLGTEKASEDPVVTQAIRVLGTSRVPEVRARVLEHAIAAARAEPPRTRHRAELVAALSQPLSTVEARAAFDALQALTEARAATSPWERYDEPRLWELVQRLLRQLPPDLLPQSLAGAWLEEDDAAGEVLTPTFLASLGKPTLSHLLTVGSTLATPVLQTLTLELAVLRDQHDLLPDPAAIELIEHAHHVLPETALASLRKRLAAMASEGALFSREIGDAPSRQQRQWSMLALQRAALASPPGWSPPTAPSAGSGNQASRDEQVRQWLLELSEPPSPPRPGEREAEPEHLALKAWTAALLPGEFSQVVLGGLDDAQLMRLGMAAGLLVLRGQRAVDKGDKYTLEAVGSDVLAVVTGMDDERLALLLAGYFTVATSITEVLLAAVLAGPLSTRVAAHRAPAPTAELVVMSKTDTSPLTLPLERELDVLEVTFSNSHLGSVAALAKTLDWVELEERGLLKRATRALAPHPALLLEALSAALESQRGPARRRASPARLEALVGEHLAAPPAAQPVDPTPMIAQLIRLSSPTLKDLAAQWMTQAPLTDPLMALVIRADEGSATQPSRYAAARTSIGRGQAQIVRDEDRDDEARVTALRRAVTADPAQAREVALAVITDAGLDLRHAAAEVLATTPGSASEAPVIEGLITGEEHADVALLLRQAQRRLASGTLGEALANLVQLVGASPALADLDIAVCLPYPQWHDTFRTRVDRARSATTEGTESHLNTLVVLSDLLADQAIAATYLASANLKEQERGRLISENAHGRPEAGALAWDGALRQKLTWLPTWAGLRAERVAHPAPLGDTTHRDISEADVSAALVALRRVSEGWLRAMHVASGTPFPLDEA